jgi:uncharacterized membrane-anchored protein
MTFPAAGSAADLALLLADHHGAALIVTAGHTANIEDVLRPVPHSRATRRCS